ncbi:MAG TPA: hypothetical protein VGF84_05105 [Micromonosporaceae bacterium]|jgi:hypothetical protein
MTELDAAAAGLQTLVPEAARLLKSLDALLEGWAIGDGADSMILPALLPVADLANLDVHGTHPHRALVVCAVDLERRGRTSQRGRSEFQVEEMEAASVALPTAACFAVYLHFRDREIADRRLVTVLGRCFHHEGHADGVPRILGFHMREVVALGSPEYVASHLRRYSVRIAALAAALDLDMRTDVATDPFHDRNGQRAQYRQLSRATHEFLVGERRIASLDVQRNFFGERCGIRLAGTPDAVFTGCVAFRLERWLAALAERYGDWLAAADALSAVADRWTAVPV